MLPLQLQQLFVKKIVVAVAYCRTRLDVLKPVMTLNLRTEELDAFPYAFHVHGRPLLHL